MAPDQVKRFWRFVSQPALEGSLCESFLPRRKRPVRTRMRGAVGAGG